MALKSRSRIAATVARNSESIATDTPNTIERPITSGWLRLGCWSAGAGNRTTLHGETAYVEHRAGYRLGIRRQQQREGRDIANDRVEGVAVAVVCAGVLFQLYV